MLRGDLDLDRAQSYIYSWKIVYGIAPEIRGTIHQLIRNKAVLMSKRNRYQEAEQLFKEAIAEVTTHQGRNIPLCYRCWLNTATYCMPRIERAKQHRC